MVAKLVYTVCMLVQMSVYTFFTQFCTDVFSQVCALIHPMPRHISSHMSTHSGAGREGHLLPGHNYIGHKFIGWEGPLLRADCRGQMLEVPERQRGEAQRCQDPIFLLKEAGVLFGGIVQRFCFWLTFCFWLSPMQARWALVTCGHKIKHPSVLAPPCTVDTANWVIMIGGSCLFLLVGLVRFERPYRPCVEPTACPPFNG